VAGALLDQIDPAEVESTQKILGATESTGQDRMHALHAGYRSSGLASDLWPDPVAGGPGGARPDTGAGGLTAEQAAAARAHELGRIAHFLPRLQAARMPGPAPGATVAAAWGEWLPLLDGDGIRPDDQRALIVRRDLGGGRIWGTTSISLVAATAAGLRYDFTAIPGDPAAWFPVPLDVPLRPA